MASSQIELDMKEQQIQAYKVKVDELETQLEKVRLSELQLSRPQETIAELELKVANLTQQLESSNKLLAELNLKEEKIRQLTNQVDKLEKQLEASKVTFGFRDKFALVNGDISELSAAIPLKKQILLDT
ncbi:hypothetical protein HDE_11176 [Halotydeus destructor]|nr:hypothetical protein HDE_11176 [Halotydeus destructor]